MVKPIDKLQLDDFKPDSMKDWKVTNGILAGRKVHLTIDGKDKAVSFNQLYKTLENLTTSLSDEKKEDVLRILTAIQILDGANKTSNPLTQLFNFTFNRAQVIKEIENKATDVSDSYLKLKNEVLGWVKENPKFFESQYCDATDSTSGNDTLAEGTVIVNELLSAMQSAGDRTKKIYGVEKRGAINFVHSASNFYGDAMRASWTKLCSIVFEEAKNDDEKKAIARLATIPYLKWGDGEGSSINSSKNSVEWKNSASQKLQDFVNKK